MLHYCPLEVVKSQNCTCVSEAFCQGQWEDYRLQQIESSPIWPKSGLKCGRILRVPPSAQDTVNFSQCSCDFRSHRTTKIALKVLLKMHKSEYIFQMLTTNHTCLMKEMTLCVPYLSISGKLISSQNNTSHLPSWTGARTTPLGVRRYSQ